MMADTTCLARTYGRSRWKKTSIAPEIWLLPDRKTTDDKDIFSSSGSICNESSDQSTNFTIAQNNGKKLLKKNRRKFRKDYSIFFGSPENQNFESKLTGENRKKMCKLSLKHRKKTSKKYKIKVLDVKKPYNIGGESLFDFSDIEKHSLVISSSPLCENSNRPNLNEPINRSNFTDNCNRSEVMETSTPKKNNQCIPISNKSEITEASIPVKERQCIPVYNKSLNNSIDDFQNCHSTFSGIAHCKAKTLKTSTPLSNIKYLHLPLRKKLNVSEIRKINVSNCSESSQSFAQLKLLQCKAALIKLQNSANCSDIDKENIESFNNLDCKEHLNVSHKTKTCKELQISYCQKMKGSFLEHGFKNPNSCLPFYMDNKSFKSNQSARKSYGSEDLFEESDQGSVLHNPQNKLDEDRSNSNALLLNSQTLSTTNSDSDSIEKFVTGDSRFLSNSDTEFSQFSESIQSSECSQDDQQNVSSNSVNSLNCVEDEFKNLLLEKSSHFVCESSIHKDPVTNDVPVYEEILSFESIKNICDSYENYSDIQGIELFDEKDDVIHPQSQMIENELQYQAMTQSENTNKINSSLYDGTTILYSFNKLKSFPFDGNQTNIIDDDKLSLNTSSVDLSLFGTTQILESSLTGEERVLKMCHQNRLNKFQESIPPKMLKNIRKIGEGVYGEVFLTKNQAGEPVVFKIVPIQGSIQINNEQQKTFEEILPEIVISLELSSLNNRSKFRAPNFIQVNRICCVQGAYPTKLLKAWDEFSKKMETENDKPDIFDNKQLFIIFEFANGGTDIEHFKISSIVKAKSILHQTIAALAVAEQAFEFEHRDMHWGNLLVKETREQTLKYLLNNKNIAIPSEGIQVNIIDFTLSRINKGKKVIFFNMASDPLLFTGEGEYQFDIYRLMRDANQNDWVKHCPFTNVLWLHYLTDKLITKYKYPKGKKTVNGLTELKGFYQSVLNYNSAYEVLTQSQFCNSISQQL